MKNCCVFALPHIVTTPNASALASHEIALHPPRSTHLRFWIHQPWFARLLIYLLTRSFVHSLAHSFASTLIRLHARSFICSLICSLAHFAHSLAHSFACLLTTLTPKLVGKELILISPNQAVLHHSALPYFLFTPLFILPYL